VSSKNTGYWVKDCRRCSGGSVWVEIDGIEIWGLEVFAKKYISF
jgi:hypothetical protein